MQITISDPRSSNYGNERRHWSMMRGAEHVANLGKDARGAWARWSVLPMDRAKEYQTFSSKAAALAYAATL